MAAALACPRLLDLGPALRVVFKTPAALSSTLLAEQRGRVAAAVVALQAGCL